MTKQAPPYAELIFNPKHGEIIRFGNHAVSFGFDVAVAPTIKKTTANLAAYVNEHPWLFDFTAIPVDNKVHFKAKANNPWKTKR